MAGYPADMDKIVRRTLGFKAPTVHRCEALLSRANLSDSGDQFGLEVRQCPITHGDSGEPWLIWSTAHQRFEVVGISSGSQDHIVFDFALEPPALTAVRRQAVSLGVEFGFPDTLTKGPVFTINTAKYMEPWEALPGVAALTSQLGASLSQSSQWHFGQLDSAYLSALEAATGRGSGSKRLMPAAPQPSVMPSTSREDWFDGIAGDPIRLKCAQSCRPIDLDPRLQRHLALGDPIDPKAFGAATVGGLVIPADRLPGGFEDAGLGGVVIVGGDAFVWSKHSGRIVDIERQIMPLGFPGEPAARARWPHRDPDCRKPAPSASPDAGPSPALLADSFSTPQTAPGVATVSAEAATCLTMGPGPRPLIIAAMSGPWGVPGAQAIPWASATGAYDDRVQQSLVLTLEDLTKGDRNRPILVYCRNRFCAPTNNAAAYNVALRIRHAGYSHVYWMRDGLDPWIDAGYPLWPTQARPDVLGVIAKADAALSANPDETTALLQRGVAHGLASQYQAAIADFSEALRLKPGLASAYRGRAEAYADLHDFDHALADAAEAVRLAPQDAHAQNGLCWAQAVSGRALASGMAACDAAIKASPDAEFFDSRALVKLRLGRAAEALSDYEEAIRRDPFPPHYLYGRGLAKLRLGRRDEGLTDVALARSRDPDLVAEFAGYGLDPGRP
jgi:tetratricopeptide (TPR) repeat protein